MSPPTATLHRVWPPLFHTPLWRVKLAMPKRDRLRRQQQQQVLACIGGANGKEKQPSRRHFIVYLSCCASSFTYTQGCD
ncbi:hypothetical protein LY76DRAFT_591944 [Colletotrichum caudatum]|nr:hypothetical protein LY76DRAFT_591944 [Colletotrichum caudatum]